MGQGVVWPCVLYWIFVARCRTAVDVHEQDCLMCMEGSVHLHWRIMSACMYILRSYLTGSLLQTRRSSNISDFKDMRHLFVSKHYNHYQLTLMNKAFQVTPYLTSSMRATLSGLLNKTESAIEKWFQCKRSKHKGIKSE